jgi:hypothetical protein
MIDGKITNEQDTPSSFFAPHPSVLLWHLFRAPRATDISLEPAMDELLLTASATELQALLQSGDLTSVQLGKACLNQIAI